MLQGMEEFPPSTDGDSGGIAAVRVEYAGAGEPIGHVPPPARQGDKALAVARATGGQQPVTLLDKLGERLAFERSGTRLYEAIVSKHDAYGSFPGGPTRAELEEILDEEYRHFQLLSRVTEELGGDPTAVTPSAHLKGVATHGFVKVVVEPRTTLLQSLEIALLAELTDTSGWDALVDLARRAGQGALAREFSRALTTEDSHLRRVRRWVGSGHGENGHSADSGARTRFTPTSGRTRMDPTQLLKRQHREVEGLFRKIKRAKGSDERRSLLDEIEQKLDLHMRIEEEIFYPAVKGLETKKAEETINEAYEEHAVVKLALAQLPQVDPEDERFEAKMTVLSEMIQHHVEEEEKEMFKIAQKLGDEELSALGAKMAEVAAEHGAEPVGAGRDGSGRNAKRGTR
jgi:rubrerythrin